MRFIQRWFSSRHGPIGVDFGTEWLRLAQVGMVKGRPHLIAASAVEVPAAIRSDWSARLCFLCDALRSLVSRGGFRGRHVAIALPAARMHLQRLRLPPFDDNTTKDTIAFEALNKLPIHPTQALIRHVVAGQVYEDEELKSEVIVMAARRKLMDDLLAAANDARLSVTGVWPEPMAIADCLAGDDSSSPPPGGATAFVDIGGTGTRVYIVHGPNIQFARSVPIGSHQFAVTIARSLDVGLAQAEQLWKQWAGQLGNPADGHKNRGIELRSRLQGAKRAPANPGTGSGTQSQRVESACRPMLWHLIEEIELSRRYHASTFPATPIQDLVFLGGTSGQRQLCQQIAAALELPADTGMPLKRIPPACPRVAGQINNGHPQSAWTVAIGVSLSGMKAAA